jgi:hypothetical protein
VFSLIPQVDTVPPTKRMHVVTANEVPPPKPKPLSLLEAVERGDYLKILKAQRRDIARSLPGEKGPAQAALHRQLALISREIESLELSATAETSVVACTPDEKFDPGSISMEAGD